MATAVTIKKPWINWLFMPAKTGELILKLKNQQVHWKK